jgi:hypothetical protein
LHGLAVLGAPFVEIVPTAMVKESRPWGEGVSILLFHCVHGPTLDLTQLGNGLPEPAFFTPMTAMKQHRKMFHTP